MSCNWKTILATVCGVITVRGLKDKGLMMSTVVFGLAYWESEEKWILDPALLYFGNQRLCILQVNGWCRSRKH